MSDSTLQALDLIDQQLDYLLSIMQVKQGLFTTAERLWFAAIMETHNAWNDAVVLRVQEADKS